MTSYVVCLVDWWVHVIDKRLIRNIEQIVTKLQIQVKKWLLLS